LGRDIARAKVGRRKAGKHRMQRSRSGIMRTLKKIIGIRIRRSVERGEVSSHISRSCRVRSSGVLSRFDERSLKIIVNRSFTGKPLFKSRDLFRDDFMLIVMEVNIRNIERVFQSIEVNTYIEGAGPNRSKLAIHDIFSDSSELVSK